MKKFIITAIPLSVFLLLAIFLMRGLSLDPHKLPSPLINKPAPTFQLPTMQQENKFSNQDLTKHYSLVNVWATWCISCREEHAVLMKIAKTHSVNLYGIDYKDHREQAKLWLTHYGNPYNKIGFDNDGMVAIDWGVYGTPETFLVDSKGIIRYKHVGPLTLAIWRNEFIPLIQGS